MKNKVRLFLFSVIIGTLILLGGFFLDLTEPMAASDQVSPEYLSDRDQEIVVRLYFDSQEQLNAVSGGLDIWEVQHVPGIGPASGYALAAIDPAQMAWLESIGYRVEIDQEHTELLNTPEAVLDPRYYYFDDYFNNPNNRYIKNFVQDTNTAYPDLTELLDIGDAWLSTQPGGYHRDIWVLRISNEDPAFGDIASKPPFFLFANVHAREVSTPEMAIRYIKYLTEGYNGQGGYNVDPDVTWLVNHHATYILVSENPDGRVKNEQNTGAYWRKNVDNDDGCQYNYGVDLNRNSSFKWGCCGGSSGDPCSEVYRGPSRASEPEISAFQAFAAQIFSDWNGNNGDDEIGQASPDDTPGLFISLHSYQDEILWPFGFNQYGAPNYNQLKTIGRKLALITTVMDPTGFLYTVDGSNDDWVYGKLGIASFTYEIGPTWGSCGDFFPAYGCQDGIDGMPRNFWAEMGPSFVYANKIAGSPYTTAYGPDAVELSVTPDDVPGGVPVDLTGVIQDTRFGSDATYPIAAAEYFIDAPGEDSTGVAMSSSDGSWGEKKEDVEAVVDTSTLSEGKHYILVHGMNDQGKWGPFTAVFLNVSTPSYGVMLSPESAAGQADPGNIVTYNLQVKNIGLNADSYNISVESAWEYSAPSTIGPLAPGEVTVFEVQVTISADAMHGESDTAIITVTSQYRPDVSDTSSLTSTANFYNLALNPPSAQANGYPGGQAFYTLHLTNEGNITDSFAIQSTSEWNISHPIAVGPLDPGSGIDIELTVDVPPSATPGDFDTATVTATSQGDSTKSQSSTLTTTAIQAGPMVNPTSDEGSGDPGTEVVYLLEVTNHNFLTDTFTITVQSSWEMTYPASVGPMPAEGTTEVEIRVLVPTGAAGGAVDSGIVTFTSSYLDLPKASSTLTTTANNVYSFLAEPVEDTLVGHGRGAEVQYTVLVTNTSNTEDTFNISVLSLNWIVDAPAQVGPVARGETALVYITVHVPYDIAMGDSNDARVTFYSQGNLKSQTVHLYTNTFWYDHYLPLSLKH
jgi:hypothetical protein